MLKTKEEIEKWLNGMKVTNYIINDDLTVDVNGDVYLALKDLTVISVQFRKVSGSFWCYGNQLKNLRNCPEYVGGDFGCSSNRLISLKGCPEYVGGFFSCSHNNLTSLKYCPDYVGLDVYSDFQNFDREQHKQFVKLQKRKEKLNSLDLE